MSAYCVECGAEYKQARRDLGYLAWTVEIITLKKRFLEKLSALHRLTTRELISILGRMKQRGE